MFKVLIETENDGVTAAWIALALEHVARKVQHSDDDGGLIVDPNGNTVGRWRFVGGRQHALDGTGPVIKAWR